ncbi:hypothetical protein D9615_002052 [Tricholomella constricta]|uniref:Kinase n=1 Tax=Tricholomella constricta TaxID=117010 RepID=A0A8H5HPD6_9AGAR|nr:hypothetical protein D9615_002052 [Tricholomella constricta]
MSMESSISTAKPLASQVGGHAGVLTTEDGSLIIKPALPLELQFYQALQQNTDLEPLRPFIPNFLGTLKLEGQLDEAKSAEEGTISVAPVDNISHPFLKPNILDVKLGTVLYDESASPEKVERMIQTAKNTTSFETGIRLTGFQVYDNITSEAVNTPKSYGKSIKPADLPDGIARFFPVGAPPVQEGEERLHGASTSGLPLKTLLPILQGIRDEIADIKQAFSEIEVTMAGGSLLIVYEADWLRAEEVIRKFLEDGECEDEEEEDEDEDEDEEAGKRQGPPFTVKLIDFAHTRLAPGTGPDEGALLGMNTVLTLIDGRIAQLEENI